MGELGGHEIHCLDCTQNHHLFITARIPNDADLAHFVLEQLAHGFHQHQ
jgi:hypothetical protein